jgi:hypothetical protein
MTSCKAMQPNGEPCSVRPLIGSEWCFNHSPDEAVGRLRDAARRSGGEARGKQLSRQARPPQLEKPSWWRLAELTDVRDAYAWCIRGLVEGSLDARTANALTSALHGLAEVRNGLNAESRERALAVVRRDAR